MLIGALARQAGRTPSAVRFYEKKGLLGGEHKTRLDNNYKDYGPVALDRLRLIAQAKGVGFALGEIERHLLDWGTRGPAERRQILQDKVRQIERRVAELEAMKAHLAAKIAALVTGAAADRPEPAPFRQHTGVL